jgi:hypothetical protein
MDGEQLIGQLLEAAETDVNKKNHPHSGLGNLLNVREELLDLVRPSQGNQYLSCHDLSLQS